MAKTGNTRFRKGDIIAVAAVLLLALFVAFCYLPGNAEEGAFAEIYQNGEKIKTVPLNREQSFTVGGAYDNEITVADGKIAITHSNCPGEDCVHSGWISSPGRSVVCLPNKLEIRVLGQADSVDFVVG